MSIQQQQQIQKYFTKKMIPVFSLSSLMLSLLLLTLHLQLHLHTINGFGIFCNKRPIRRRDMTTTTTTTTKTKKLSFTNNRHLSVLSSSLSSSSSSSEIATTTTTTTVEDNNILLVPTEFQEEEEDITSSPSATSVQVPTEWRKEVLSKLRTIIDPDLNSDIVSLGFVKNLQLSSTTNTNIVSFDVELTTPACPVKDMFAEQCEKYVKELQWVTTVQVSMTAQIPKPIVETDVFGMNQIGAIIAVSSCKGGVGKSTTAVNLAYTLSTYYNASVGIFDADLYGPSLPTMVTPDDDIVRFAGRQILPLQYNNVKLMSFGYINDGSAIMRGPMIQQLLDQLLNVIQWGSLDYLILDLPPGTGDVQLSLTQRLNITAAVIVTTPTQLSFNDVIRGIDMFNSVNVPCIAVVENMAYYDIPTPKTPIIITTSDTTEDIGLSILSLNEQDTLKDAFIKKLESSQSSIDIVQNGELSNLANDLVQLVVKQQQEKMITTTTSAITSSSISTTTTTTVEDENNTNNRIQIFGSGHKNKLALQYGIEHTYSIPLIENLAYCGDNGIPYVLQYPNSSTTTIYKNLTKSVIQEVSKLKFGKNRIQQPIVSYNKEQHNIEVITSIPTTNIDNNKVDNTVTDEDEATATTTTTITTKTTVVSTSHLRLQCRCASCVEELTGRQLLLPKMVSESIYPLNLYPTGNYALSIDWSDGHRSLYPYKQIQSIINTINEK